MKARFSIKTMALVSTIDCALPFVLILIMTMTIATFGMARGAISAQSPSRAAQPPSDNAPQTYEGVITDSHCGAKHSAAIDKAAANCTVACVHAGERFVLIDGDTMYLLEGDMVALKQVAGQRVKIVGILNGTKISVRSVVAT